VRYNRGQIGFPRDALIMHAGRCYCLVILKRGTFGDPAGVGFPTLIAL